MIQNLSHQLTIIKLEFKTDFRQQVHISSILNSIVYMHIVDGILYHSFFSIKTLQLPIVGFSQVDIWSIKGKLNFHLVLRVKPVITGPKAAIQLTS